MNCHEFWEQEPAALEHLEECRACANRYTRLQQLGAGLRTLGTEWRHLSAPARVERRLVAAFRAQPAVAAPPRRTGWIPMAAWAAAVAATVLAGFLLLEDRQPRRSHRIAANAIEVAVVEPAESVTGVAEGYEDFIPLPNAETIAPNEQVNLVRVAVPRSAMIPLGFTVSEENASETVEADVVLGADGVARAVRFLNDVTY
jgi:hypothetical protein